MLPSFLIMLREGIEAALIVGIIAGYLARSGRGEWVPAVWVGVLLAVALSLFVGAAMLAIGAEFPQKAQELFEAAVGCVAVVVLLSMVFWMRKASRSIRATMEHDIDAALSSLRGPTWALIGMTFFAVAREGLESVFFLLAIIQQSPGGGALIGALLGVVVAVLLGCGLYRGGVRLDLRRFFRWTGILIVFVAAGLAASVLRHLHEAGIWNHLQQPVWDLTGVLPVTSVLGAVLSGLFGYYDAPVLGEVLVWAIVLCVSLFCFLRPAAPSAAPVRAARQEA